MCRARIALPRESARSTARKRPIPVAAAAKAKATSLLSSSVCLVLSYLTACLLGDPSLETFPEHDQRTETAAPAHPQLPLTLPPALPPAPRFSSPPPYPAPGTPPRKDRPTEPCASRGPTAKSRRSLPNRPAHSNSIQS